MQRKKKFRALMRIIESQGLIVVAQSAWSGAQQNAHHIKEKGKKLTVQNKHGGRARRARRERIPKRKLRPYVHLA
jgi:hypothetical protein